MRVDLFIWYFFFLSTTVLNCTGFKRFRVAAWLVYTDYPVSNTSIVMNDFPVIGDLVMRTGLWDRQGANIGNRYKEMYGVELFLRLKPVSLDRECRILP